MTLQPRAVVVHRRSEHEELIARHGTRQQGEFFLARRGQSLGEVRGRSDALQDALRATTAAIPPEWRRAEIERADLARFVFGPEDVIVVVGQDGLVANVAKYLDGQPVVGINPEPDRHPGVLVLHPPEGVGELLEAAVGRPTVQERTMVAATTDDGQSLLALNEVYVGHASHQSSRYQLVLPDGSRERQSSSGILAGTGTGATGWLRSAWVGRGSTLALPRPTDPTLCWFVREAWPSPVTGVTLTQGLLVDGEELTIQVESDRLVCFGDGIETDALILTWGQHLTVARAPRTLRLLSAP